MVYRNLNHMLNVIPGDGCVIVIEKDDLLDKPHVFRIKILQHAVQLVRITVLTVNDHHDASGGVDELIDVLLGIVRGVPVLVGFYKLLAVLCIDNIQEFCIRIEEVSAFRRLPVHVHLEGIQHFVFAIFIILVFEDISFLILGRNEE